MSLHLSGVDSKSTNRARLCVSLLSGVDSLEMSNDQGLVLVRRKSLGECEAPQMVVFPDDTVECVNCYKRKNGEFLEEGERRWCER